MIEVLKPHTYTWPNEGFPFAGLCIRIDELAFRLGLTLYEWDIKGLGPAKGFGFLASSGKVYLLQELQLAVKYHGAFGPEVHVDAAELVKCGAKVLADDVILALSLSNAELLIFSNESLEMSAAELIKKVADSRC